VDGEKLDAKDFNGLSDPYVILELGGKTCQTSVKKKTVRKIISSLLLTIV
jgi:Ca2+-dependent lipid-binding protein